MTRDADQAPDPTRRIYRRILWALLILSVLATGFFAARGVVQFVYWSDPAHRDQTLQPWMPVGFVARSYGLQRDALAAELGLSLSSNRRVTLESLAAMRGQTFEDLADDVEAAIRDLRSE